MLSRFLLKNPAFLRLMSLFMMLGGWDVCKSNSEESQSKYLCADISNENF